VLASRRVDHARAVAADRGDRADARARAAPARGAVARPRSVLVLDGDFRFEPGLIVTTAAAVSGLEFDAVVIPI